VRPAVPPIYGGPRFMSDRDLWYNLVLMSLMRS